MANSAAKLDVRLIVRIEYDSLIGDPYLRLSTEVVYFDVENSQWNSCGAYSTPYALRGLDNLGVYTSADKYGAQFSLYGTEPQYRSLYKTTLDDAKLMVSTLTKITRKLDKMRAELGCPESVAQQIAMFAKAVGCTGANVFGYYDKNSPRQDDQGYVWDDAEYMKSRLTRELRNFAKKYDIKQRED